MTTGFDALRLGLALLIFYSHSGWIATATGFHIGPDVAGISPDVVAWSFRAPFRTLTSMAVPMFFALSGFLVAASAQRNRNVWVFLSFRALRILPALAVEIALSAFILGPIYTSLSLWEYFADHRFWRYLLNVFGFVTLTLPGVFDNNPVESVVNVNLWTLPPEFYCYLIMFLLMASAFLYSRRVFSTLFLLSLLVLFFLHFGFGMPVQNGDNVEPWFLAYYFFAGVFMHSWRHEIMFDYRILLVVAPVAGVLMSVTELNVFAPIFLCYLTLYIGCLQLPYPKHLRENDYSYGIYLYGFPITQSLYAAAPAVAASKYGFRAASLLLASMFAMASWYLIERHALKLKPVFKRYLERQPRTARGTQ